MSITERREAEQRLQEVETRYRALVEQIPVGVYIREVEHDTIAYISLQIESMIGYSAREYREDRELWTRTTHPDDRELVLAEEARSDQSGEPFGVEVRKITCDGRVIWVRDEAVLVRDAEGRPLCWQGIFTDVTERKRAEEIRETNRRLEELAALKADFTAMVAHELAAALAVIRGYADVLATGDLEPATRSRALAKIQAETDVLDALIADVRTAAAVEREDFAVEASLVPVEELLAEGAAFAATLPGAHPLVTVISAAGRGEVWVDEYRIGQVLRNLLSNAVKYSPDGAPIELRASSAEIPGRVRIEVADRGVGVHPDDAERIFEKFGRGRDESGNKVPGVGLGLYIIRRILRAHGSELTWEPAPEGGSVFGFELEAAR